MSQKKISQKIFKVIIPLGLIVLVIFFNPWGFFDKTKNFFMMVTFPVQKVFSNAGHKMSSFSEAIATIGKIKKENK